MIRVKGIAIGVLYKISVIWFKINTQEKCLCHTLSLVAV